LHNGPLEDDRYNVKIHRRQQIQAGNIDAVKQLVSLLPAAMQLASPVATLGSSSRFLWQPSAAFTVCIKSAVADEIAGAQVCDATAAGQRSKAGLQKKAKINPWQRFYIRR